MMRIDALFFLTFIPLLFFLWRARRRGEKLAQELLQARAEKEIAEQKLAFTIDGEERAKTLFQSLSLEVLERSSRQFLSLAKATFEQTQEKTAGLFEQKEQAIASLLRPMRETLLQLDTGLRSIEKERKGEHEMMKTQLHSLLESERNLRDETANLAQALRAPSVRGKWGEIQLKRIVELAGMLPYCDFYEQQTDDTGEARPDLLIRLPGTRHVVVDAKVPLTAYLEACQTPNASTREEKFKTHAKHVRSHIHWLSRKSYFEKFRPSPEFVILFLPAEPFFSAALEWDPSIIEEGAQRNVIIATPTTLIALLRAVAYGWKQENLSERVQELHALSQEIAKRLKEMDTQLGKMGKHLHSALHMHTQLVNTWENRIQTLSHKLNQMSMPQPASESIARD